MTLPMMRTAPIECPLEDGNLLDVHLFISDEAQCKQLCQGNEVSSFCPQCFHKLFISSITVTMKN
jgi:hypothetical protein